MNVFEIYQTIYSDTLYIISRYGTFNYYFNLTTIKIIYPWS